MRTIKFIIAATALIFAVGIVNTARAEMVKLLGPVYVVNTDAKAGGANEASYIFSAPVPGYGNGVIIVRNGGDSGKKYRVSSAVVGLNGTEIAGESDFSKEVLELRYDVDLTAENELHAVVKSCINCEIEITVLGPAPTAPPVPTLPGGPAGPTMP